MPRQQNAGAGRVRAAGVACEVLEATSGGYLGVVINTLCAATSAAAEFRGMITVNMGQNGERVSIIYRSRYVSLYLDIYSQRCHCMHFPSLSPVMRCNTSPFARLLHVAF